MKQIAASEHELRSGSAELVSREEVLEMVDRSEDVEERGLDLDVQAAGR